ncbi:PAS domain-containing protein [Clostridium sp. DJ247]|nr:PAS domain-containing protein [Clostridium sp. DJ247]
MHSKRTQQNIIFFIFFIIFFFSLQKSVHALGADEKSVLILSSSANGSTILSGYESKEWTDEIISSINSQFVDSKKNINIKMQYMGFGEKSWPQYYELYKYNFTDTRFDVVISLDDNAFNFLLKYGDKLFPNTPVVFSGVHNFNKSTAMEHPLFTGRVKSNDIRSTLDIALKLHPNTKQIFVIDSYVGGLQWLIPLYKDKVNIVFCNESNIIKIKEKINNLPKDTVIYFSKTFYNDKGQNIPVQKITDFLFKDINIPVYSIYYIELNRESVGGMITYGSDLGKEVGQLALRILNGEKPSNIPITEDSSHKYAFNYEQLKKFHIDLKSLPKGSDIVNVPKSFYTISKKIILYITAIILLIITSAIIFIIINIYKRRRVERLLSESESLLNTLINYTPSIIYFKNAEGKFLDVNNTTLTLLNIHEKDYKNKRVHELTNVSVQTKYLLAKWANKDEKAWKLGTIYRCEEVILDEKEKIDKIYDILRIPLFNDDGTRKGLILLGVNITEHKHNEENEKLIKDLMYYDNLRSNFFSNISHELRTPLNLIFSALQVIELRTISDKEKYNSEEKYITIMRQNCYRLLRIIGNLIDITKIDAGHFFTQPQNRDIVNIIENIVLSVVQYVESKGISITFDTEIEEKIMAFDPDAMERIILNLLSNSIKFTPNGGSIEVNIYEKVNSIVISVKDTGLGIPKEKQACIFEKFVQVDKSLSRNREGSGIGLSLVKELVVIHGGTIKLESTLGKGSEFKIELPVRLVHEDEKTTELNTYTSEDKVERIKIEFSDIYN